MTPFANTETERDATLRPEGQRAESPEGPGREENKPLMQNPTATERPSPIGSPGRNTFTSGSLGVVWGVPASLKPLPDGWEYISDPENFLRAKSPDGRLWLVVAQGVVRIRIATTEDERRSRLLRAGHEYIDETEKLTFTGWAAL